MYPRGFNLLQKISLSLMAALVLLTFVGSNLYAILWQKSGWLVGTVLPAVVVDLTNEQRAENNAAPLTRSTVLDQAAQLKAEHMAKYQYFAHYSPDGVSPWHWFDEAGYVYAHAGENLAIHFTDSDEVVKAWMNSPAHRQNIVDSKFTEIGVGTAKGEYEGYNTVYVVQLFGAPAVSPASIKSNIGQESVVAAVPVPAVVAPEPIAAAEVVPVLSAPVIPEVEGEQTRSLPNVAASEPVGDPTPLLSTKKEASAPLSPAEKTTTDFPVTAEKNTVTMANDIVVIESPAISVSSGLAAAQVTTENNPSHAGATVSAVLTKPSDLLQFMYMVIGSIVVLLLSLSVVMEARRWHLAQVAYGIMLLCSMGALWYMHVLLTSGAVVT